MKYVTFLSVVVLLLLACEGPVGPAGPGGPPGETDGLILIQKGKVGQGQYIYVDGIYWVKFYLPGTVEAGVFWLRLFPVRAPAGMWWIVDAYKIEGHELLVSDGQIYLLEKRYELWGMIVSLLPNDENNRAES